MNRELAEAIVEACELSGVDAEVYENYSGRGMYGEKTTGVATGSGVAEVDVLTAVLNNPELFVDEDGNAVFEIRPLRSDSLGRGAIIY